MTQAVLHELPATPATVHWGSFDASLAPVLTFQSGDLVRIETLTHHAGDLRRDVLSARAYLTDRDES